MSEMSEDADYKKLLQFYELLPDEVKNSMHKAYLEILVFLDVFTERSQKIDYLKMMLVHVYKSGGESIMGGLKLVNMLEEYRSKIKDLASEFRNQNNTLN